MKRIFLIVFLGGVLALVNYFLVLSKLDNASFYIHQDEFSPMSEIVLQNNNIDYREIGVLHWNLSLSEKFPVSKSFYIYLSSLYGDDSILSLRQLSVLMKSYCMFVLFFCLGLGFGLPVATLTVITFFAEQYKIAQNIHIYEFSTAESMMTLIVSLILLKDKINGVFCFLTYYLVLFFLLIVSVFTYSNSWLFCFFVSIYLFANLLVQRRFFISKMLLLFVSIVVCCLLYDDFYSLILSELHQKRYVFENIAIKQKGFTFESFILTQYGSLVRFLHQLFIFNEHQDHLRVTSSFLPPWLSIVFVIGFYSMYTRRKFFLIGLIVFYLYLTHVQLGLFYPRMWSATMCFFVIPLVYGWRFLYSFLRVQSQYKLFLLFIVVWLSVLRFDSSFKEIVGNMKKIEYEIGNVGALFHEVRSHSKLNSKLFIFPHDDYWVKQFQVIVQLVLLEKKETFEKTPFRYSLLKIEDALKKMHLLLSNEQEHQFVLILKDGEQVFLDRFVSSINLTKVGTNSLYSVFKIAN